MITTPGKNVVENLQSLKEEKSVLILENQNYLQKISQLETEISKLSANYETKLKERTAELSSALKEKESLQAALEKQIAAVKATEEKAVAQRADALRERIARQKLEAELASMQAAAKQAAEAEAAAAKAKAEYEAQLLIIAPIYFGKNQADSEQQEQSLLAQVKEISTLFPQARYSISGHTCTDGTPAGNLALSQRRAQRVANLLVTNGIPSAAIAEVIGKGQETPIADNNTQQGREANRRVEIKVLKE